ncbi:MAG TPA: hypothetical protein VK195_11645 [Burkholderiaceae bacterium]|nr:hypothetical protein [Burkholderiaceae bacterium]
MKGQYANSSLARHLHACLAWICQGSYLSLHARRAGGFAAVLQWFAGMALLGLVLEGQAQAQTSVSGSLEADARWSAAYAPYKVDGDLVIRNGATLTIDPGVVIYMASGANVRVESGSVQAIGRADRPIQVLSDKVRQGLPPGAGDWGQWQFNAGTVRTRLEWVQFQHGSGLSVRGSAPVLNQLSFKSHLGAAISVDLQASPIGVGLSASDCGINGIAVEAGDVTGTLSWGLRGIPYVVTGTLSVGQSPKVASSTPATFEQGQSGSLVLNGARLQGLKSAQLSNPAIVLTPFAGGTDSTQTFDVKVAPDAALGPVALTLLVDAGELLLPNLFQVTVPIPQITELVPSSITAMSGTSALQVKGRNFSAASQVLADGVDIPTTFSADPPLLRATLPQQTGAGSVNVQVRNPAPGGAGLPLLSAPVPLLVKAPAPQSLSVEPNPIAMPPDKKWRDVQIVLARVDSMDRVVNVDVQDPGRISVSVSTLTIAAGQTKGTVSLSPLVAGTTQLQLSSPGLAPLSVPIFVTADYAGVGASYSRQVLVSLPKAAAGPITSKYTAGTSTVGVNAGATLVSLAPTGMLVGTEKTFTIGGLALPADAQISLQPSGGMTVDQVQLAPDGQSLTFRVVAEASATPGPRRVVVKRATGQFLVFAQASGSSIQLTSGVPRIDSVSPQALIAGSTTRVQIRGANLQGVKLGLDREAGVVLDALPVISAHGDLIDLDVAVAAGAELGLRRVQATHAGGSSPSESASGNTFQVVAAGNYAQLPVVSPAVRVKVGTTKTGGSQQITQAAQSVTVLAGMGVHTLQPKSGVRGTDLTLTVKGNGLGSVATVRMVPADDISLGGTSISGDGSELRIPVSIAAGASLGPRRLQLLRADGLQFAATLFDGLTFLVTQPVPVVESVTPQYLLRGSTYPITVRGVNLSNVVSVRVVPEAGMTVNAPFVSSPDGNQLSFSLGVDSSAAPVDRQVIVQTAAGTSSTEPAPANLLHVLSTPPLELAPVAGRVVKVQMGGGLVPPAKPAKASVVAPTVGVTVPEPPKVPTQSGLTAAARPVFIINGAVAYGLEQMGWLQGSSGDLVIVGQGLDQVVSVKAQPADGVVLGTPVLEEAGARLRIPLQVAADAPYTARLMVLGTTNGRLAWTAPAAGQLQIGQLPVMASLSPLSWSRGTIMDVVIRGSKLRGAKSAAVIPADGVEVLSDSLVWSTDALGEKLALKVRVNVEAALGDRVLQLQVPGGATPSEPSPSNRISIQF